MQEHLAARTRFVSAGTQARNEYSIFVRGYLDAHRCLDACGQHVNPRLDRHGPGIVEAVDLDVGIHSVRQFIGGSATVTPL